MIGQETDLFPLQDLLWCASCERVLVPVESAGQPGMYRCDTGCRRTRIDATAIERLVHIAVERHSPALIGQVPRIGPTELYRRLIARIVVGTVVHDAMITWRI
ncbi:MAG TPA: zinc ribbon domain-containing protein [Micromonosporaceae bacterium]